MVENGALCRCSHRILMDNSTSFPPRHTHTHTHTPHISPHPHQSVSSRVLGNICLLCCGFFFGLNALRFQLRSTECACTCAKGDGKGSVDVRVILNV
mmetsp:Transcript_3091/g.5968  ORF Transcript_3091/g.5968 Transcript_3091/m.5968 type:complete len:97 (-) Transcript_3091:8-298(-)